VSSTDPQAQSPHPGGCGLQTCLVLAMVVSAALVAVMIGLAMIRLSEMR
jgi:hypothetical protein